MAKSINEQIRAAVEHGGGQGAVARTIQAAGGKTTQPQLSRLCSWQRPSLETLVEIAKAVGGWKWDLDGNTHIGTSRPAAPSEKKSRRKKKTTTVA